MVPTILPVGFSMLKNQLVVLPKDTSIVNLYAIAYVSSVQIFSYDTNETYTLPYDLVINTSQNAPCPANCNGNGVCQSNGSCYCAGSYIGYDCSVIPYQLQNDKDLSVNASAMSFTYLRIPQSEFASSSTSTTQSQSILQIDLDNIHCEINMYMKQQSSGGLLISPFSYTKAQVLS
jgi:hypothetical protein